MSVERILIALHASNNNRIDRRRNLNVLSLIKAHLTWKVLFFAATLLQMDDAEILCGFSRR